MRKFSDIQPANSANIDEYRRTMKAIASQPDQDQFDPSLLMIVEITADLTLDPLIHGNKMLQVNSAGDVTLTLPADAPRGFVFSVDQVGAGSAVFAVAGAATLVSRASHTKTAGAGAQMGLYVRTNAAGNNAVYVLTGDGAA